MPLEQDKADDLEVSLTTRRVTIRTQRGSVFDGQTGVITRTAPETTIMMVRLDISGMELPFDKKELIYGA